MQHASDTFSGETEVDLDGQDITCTIIDNVEDTASNTVDRRAAHDVHGPDLIGM